MILQLILDVPSQGYACETSKKHNQSSVILFTALPIPMSTLSPLSCVQLGGSPSGKSSGYRRAQAIGNQGVMFVHSRGNKDTDGRAVGAGVGG